MILNLLFTRPEQFFIWILALVAALTVHEFFHAFVARALGDRTAEDAGRLTLNPVKHLDPFGTILLLTVGFGWGRPVPVNPYNLRSPRWGNVLVSAAGPLSNLLMVVVFGLGFRFAFASARLGPDNLLVGFLAALVLVNLILFVFNLIPIPPLDGSKVLFGLLPRTAAPVVAYLERTGPLLLLLLFLVDGFGGLNLFGTLFSTFGRLVSALLRLPPVFG